MAAKPQDFGALHGWAMIWTLLGVFAGGLALNLTPCVYPMIPITVSYFGGRTALGRGSLAAHGALYLLGLSATNSLLGVIAALTGSLMGAALQSPFVLLAIAAVLVLFATSLFGLWEFRLPQFLSNAASASHAGYFGTLFMGLTLGVVAAPCLGPFVLGLLAWVASLGSPWLGFLIFFTLSLGLGLPLFILAIFSGSLERLPRSGDWMLWVRKVMGWVLVGMAAHFVRPVLPHTAGIFLVAGVALAAGVHLTWIDRTATGFRGFSLVKTTVGTSAFVIALVFVGSWFISGPGVAWQPYSEEVIEKARILEKPVIIDISASWCSPCRHMESVTFHDPEVVKRAERDFVMIKVDVTQKDSPQNEEIIRRFAVKGVPTVLFIDAHGREREDLRLVDFITPDGFLTYMARVIPMRVQGSD